MHLRTLKTLAVLCLALAIGAVADSLRSSWRAGDIMGPSALVVTAQREVWIGVDDALWRVRDDGRLLDTVPLQALGLPGAPANLVRHPNGSIVASVRDDPRLFVLDAASARVVRSLRPRWPAELERHGGRAINIAFHPDGRFAIATGGGHAVALFDAEGGFIARTAPDTYRFTNGLWWVDDDLWTTDTNRTQLKRLSGPTWAVEQTVDVARDAPPYLGPARAHPDAGRHAAAQAALIRFHNGMIFGAVSRVAGDGHDAPYPHGTHLEPRDLDWLDDQLLVTDGESFSVLRWSAAREPLPAFGDAALQERLHALLLQRRSLERRHAVELIVAIVAFAFAAAGLLWGERLKRRERVAIDLSKLVTPVASPRQLLRLQWRMSWPLLVAMLPLLALRWPPATSWVRNAGGIDALIALFGLVVLLLIVAMAWLVRRALNLARDPGFEPLLNGLALRKLQRSEQLLQVLRDGEHVVETFSLRRQSVLWVVVTDERLLVFKATLFDETLARAIALDEIVGVSTERGSFARGGAGRWAWPPFQRRSWIEIALRDGKVLSGQVGAESLAQRLAARLMTGSRRPLSKRPAVAVGRAPNISKRRWALALVSALVPGAGQWVQRRGRIALLMFTPWLAVLLFFSVPLVWVLLGPRAAVSPHEVVILALVHLLMAATAAWDAWRMTAPPR